jgi:hypothetical protein
MSALPLWTSPPPKSFRTGGLHEAAALLRRPSGAPDSPPRAGPFTCSSTPGPGRQRTPSRVSRGTGPSLTGAPGGSATPSVIHPSADRVDKGRSATSTNHGRRHLQHSLAAVLDPPSASADAIDLSSDDASSARRPPFNQQRLGGQVEAQLAHRRQRSHGTSGGHRPPAGRPAPRPTRTSPHSQPKKLTTSPSHVVRRSGGSTRRTVMSGRAIATGCRGRPGPDVGHLGVRRQRRDRGAVQDVPLPDRGTSRRTDEAALQLAQVLGGPHRKR